MEPVSFRLLWSHIRRDVAKERSHWSPDVDLTKWDSLRTPIGRWCYASLGPTYVAGFRALGHVAAFVVVAANFP